MLSAEIEPRIADAFQTHGQGQVLRHAAKLTPHARAELAAQLAEVDLALMTKLIGGHDSESKTDFAKIAPAPYIALGTPATDARAHGESMLRAGKVAAFTVAGGQGTRLGWRGPKGTYPATVVTGKPLFRVFAEQIAAAEKRYGCAIPWYIMTSPLNDADTRAFFKDNNWFGRNPADTFLFPQGTMPSITFDGKLMLETPGSLAVNPDGHGGAIRALHHSGALEDMQARGIAHMSYFQVDNPLAMPLAAEFLGYHLLSIADFSTQVVRKNEPGERVGIVVESNGRHSVVEYSDLPAPLAAERRADGRLRFHAGSIAIHAFTKAFLDRAATQKDALPLHLAFKAVPCLDADGHRVVPTSPNAIKFERFIFDLMPLAERVCVVEVEASEGFAPLKNPAGSASDAPEHVHAALVAHARRLLARAGVDVADGIDVELAANRIIDETDIDGLLRAGTVLERPVVIGG